MEDSDNNRKETLLTIVFTPLNEGYTAVVEGFPEIRVQGKSFSEVKEKLGIVLKATMPGRAPYGIKPIYGFRYVIKTLACEK